MNGRYEQGPENEGTGSVHLCSKVTWAVSSDVHCMRPGQGSHLQGSVSYGCRWKVGSAPKEVYCIDNYFELLSSLVVAFLFSLVYGLQSRLTD